MASATVQLNARVPEPVHKKLQELARRENTSITHEVNIALRAHLDAQGKGNK